MPSFIDYNKASPFLTVIHGDDPLDYTGRSVASGDINGDGIDDAIIGAPQHFQFTIGRAGGGRVYVVYGRRDWPREIDLDTDGAAVPGVTRIVGKAPENFAGEVACGDVNGDGYFDVVIGAFGAGPDGCCGKVGEAYVLFGSDSLDAIVELQNAQAGLTTIQGLQGARIGEFLGCAEIDGDAFWDVLIGAPDADRDESGGANAGKVYILHGAERFPQFVNLDVVSTASSHRQTVIIGPSRGEEIGWEFSAGDLNGDAIPELLLGTRHRAKSKQYSPSHGKMYVPFGKSIYPSTIDLSTYDDKLILYGRDLGTDREPADQLGQELAAGDFNGDGFADILTSAPFARASGASTGECYIISMAVQPLRKKRNGVFSITTTMLKYAVINRDNGLAMPWLQAISMVMRSMISSLPLHLQAAPKAI